MNYAQFRSGFLLGILIFVLAAGLAGCGDSTDRLAEDTGNRSSQAAPSPDVTLAHKITDDDTNMIIIDCPCICSRDNEQ